MSDAGKILQEASQFLGCSIDYTELGCEISSVDDAQNDQPGDGRILQGQSTRLIAATVPQPYVAASVLTQEHRCLVDQALKDVECGGHTGSGLPSAFFQQCMTKFWKSVQTLASSGFVHAGMLVEKTLSEVNESYLVYTVWCMCSSGLVSLQQLLGGDCLNLPAFTEHLQVMRGCLQGDRRNCSALKAVMQDILIWLLHISDDATLSGTKVASEILDLITEECWCHLRQQVAFGSLQRIDPPTPHTLLHLLCHARISKDTIQRLGLRCLHRFLLTTPSMEVLLAFSTHQNYALSKLPPGVVFYLREILAVISLEGVLKFVTDQLGSNIGKEVHCAGILSCSSVALVCKSGFSARLQESCAKSISSSLEQLDAAQFIRAVLLARHAGLAGADVFPPYSQWFRVHLSGAVNPLPSSQRAMQFFFQTMSSMVPHESIEAIRVHCSSIQVEPKYRQFYLDFVHLSSTRRKDLSAKTSAEAAGATEGLDAAQIRTMEDVAEALKIFEATGTVSKKVLKSSVFERPYFKGQFLPCLVTPAKRSDISEVREKFISKLVSIGKAQASSLASYQTSCQKLAIRTEENNSLERLTEAELLQQFYNVVETVCDGTESDLDVLINHAARKYGPSEFESIPIWQVNVVAPNLPIIVVQMVDCVLQLLGDSMLREMNFPPSPSLLRRSRLIFTCMSSTRLFQFVVYVRLWDLVEHNLATMNDAALKCVALCLHHIRELGEKWSRFGAFGRQAHFASHQCCRQLGGCDSKIPDIACELLESVTHRLSKAGCSSTLLDRSLALFGFVAKLSQYDNASI